MKNLVLAILSTFLLFSGFTSEDKLGLFLSEVFSEEQVKEIIADPQLNKYYTNLLFHSFSIEEVPIEKGSLTNLTSQSEFSFVNKNGSITTISAEEVKQLIETNTFNILKFQLPREFDQPTTLLLGDTRTVLQISSYSHLSKLQQK